MRVTPRDGWLPAQIEQVEGRLQVVAVRLGSRPLTAPFLELDLDACTESAHVPLDEAMETAAAPRDLPAGFVFHMSRAGSTVGGMMLRATRQVALVSEPLAVNGLFYRTNDDEERLAAQVRFVIDWFMRALGRGQRVVFKFASWLALHLDRFQRWYPSVPCAFAYRDPVEVVSSIVQRPAFLFRRSEMRRRIRSAADPAFERRLDWSLRGRVDYWRESSYAEFVTRFVGAICEPAARIVTSRGTILPIDYVTFTRQVVEELAPAIGLQVDARMRQRMLEATTHDVKAIGRQVPFRADSLGKRQLATPEIRRVCEAFIQPSIDLLRRTT